MKFRTLFRILRFALVLAVLIEALHYALTLQNTASDLAVLCGGLLFILSIAAFATFVVATIIKPFLKSQGA
jgi:hypothetical protein